MKKTNSKSIFILLAMLILASSVLSGCNNLSEYKFLKGTWRNQEWNSHTDIWFNEDISEFKYLFQNEYTGVVQRWEGTVEKNKNETTNQISIKLVIDETSSFSFIVKSDSEGKTYLEDTSGSKFYKVWFIYSNKLHFTYKSHDLKTMAFILY